MSRARAVFSPTPGTPGKRTTPGGISLDPPDFSKGSWRSSSSGGTGSSAAKGSSGLGTFSQSFSERVERAREAARGEKTAAKASKTDDLPPLADRYAEWDADLPSTAQSELSRAAEQASQGFAAAFGFETKTAEPVPVIPTGQVVVTGDAEIIQLRGAGGTARPGDVPVGQWTVFPSFPGGYTVKGPTITVVEGQTLRLRCTSSERTCSIQ